MIKNKRFGLFFAVAFLVSCKPEVKNYDYWMLHPHELQHELQACEAHNVPLCQTLQQAGKAFSQLANEREAFPEKFGEKILHAQTHFYQQQEDILQLEKEYKANPSDKNFAEKIKAAKEEHARLDHEIAVLLQVVAATTGE